MGDYLAHVHLTGDLPADAADFLIAHGCKFTVTHSRAVAATASRLALCFGVERQPAVIAGWLHDISAVVPKEDRIACARGWGVAVLPEEVPVPMIVHQKLSAWMAEHGFGITDPSILSAIRCHTTLQRDAGVLDKIVFVADKISWDQPGTPPYLAALEEALSVSLDAAACVYLDYLWQQREHLAVIHPWFAAAHHQLCSATY